MTTMNRTMMPMMALAVFFCGVATGVAEALAQKTKPNFVVIFIDDMGYGDIEPFGSQQNKTPNLTRIAAEVHKKARRIRGGCPE